MWAASFKGLAGFVTLAGGLLLKEGWPGFLNLKPSTFFSGPFGLGVLLAAVGIVVPTVAEVVKARRDKEEKTVLRRKQAVDGVQHLLAKLGELMNHRHLPNKPVRVNIMLLEKGDLRHRRRVHSETAYNMEDPTDTDSDLEIDANAGVSGRAFLGAPWILADLTVQSPAGSPAWWEMGMAQKESNKVRKDLKAILSVPLFDPTLSRRRPQPFGTLQIDSCLGINATFQLGNDPTPQDVRLCATLATSFSDAVALLLKHGGIV